MGSRPEILERVIAYSEVEPASPNARYVFEQRGHMWRAPTAKAMAFSARQTISRAAVRFAWQARFRMLPGLTLVVTDAMDDDGGRLEGRLWGRLRLFCQRGPEVTQGQGYRYLAELPWAPGAYLDNPALRWQQLDDERLDVCTELAGQTLRVVFRIDAEGRVVEVRAEDRMREVDGRFEPTPWVGRFSAWARLGEVVVPTEAEVAWDLPEGPFTYWSARVTSHASEGTRHDDAS